MEPTLIHCHECDRGGNGNATDKCSCGWHRTAETVLGCYLGTPIVGQPKAHKPLTRSQARYRHFLAMDGIFENFGHYLRNCKG